MLGLSGSCSCSSGGGISRLGSPALHVWLRRPFHPQALLSLGSSALSKPSASGGRETSLPPSEDHARRSSEPWSALQISQRVSGSETWRVLRFPPPHTSSSPTSVFDRSSNSISSSNSSSSSSSSGGSSRSGSGSGSGPQGEAVMQSLLYHGTSPPPIAETVESGGGLFTKVTSWWTPASLFAHAKRTFNHTFLPQGFPRSVAPGYTSFSLWQLAAFTSGSVTGVLSTQTMLVALGLGTTSSLALSATLNWVIKDGIGQLGGMLYAAIQSKSFDTEPKRYRLQAIALFQLSTLLEILTPLFPSYFLLLASVSNVGKNVAMLATSASRAQISRTLAIRDNIGEITAKTTSQGIAAGLIGTALGVLLSLEVGSTTTDVMAIFLGLSAFTLFSVYKSNTHIVLRTLNVPRAEKVMLSALSSASGHSVPSPATVAQTEVFVRGYRSLITGAPNLVVEPGLEAAIRRYGLCLSDVDALATQAHFRRVERVEEDRMEKGQGNAAVLTLASRPTTITTTNNNDNMNRSRSRSGGGDGSGGGGGGGGGGGRGGTENYLLTAVLAPTHKRSLLSRLTASSRSRERRGESLDVVLWFTDAATSRDILRGFLHSVLLRQALAAQLAGLSRESYTEFLKGRGMVFPHLVAESYETMTQKFPALYNALLDSDWELDLIHVSESDGRRLNVVLADESPAKA